MAEERQDARTTPPGRRLTVSEAADALGISAEAVRSRLKRGTLRSVKDGATVYVLLDIAQSRPDTDQAPPGRDQTGDQTGDQTELVAQLRDEIAFLRDQVRRQQEITAQQAVTMHQLSAPAESDESTTVDQYEEEPQDEQHEGQETPGPGPEEPATPDSEATGEGNVGRRGWWRRIFGG
jgi:excisionase family DNA binding protein